MKTGKKIGTQAEKQMTGSYPGRQARISEEEDRLETQKTGLSMTAFTSILPTSYGYVNGFGGSPTLSGVVIGVFNAGILVGTLLSKRLGDVSAPRKTLLQGVLLLCFGLVAYRIVQGFEPLRLWVSSLSGSGF